MPLKHESDIPRTPEGIHKIIMTYPRGHFDVQKTQNLPYAGKRIIDMLHSLGITRYGMFEYELELVDDMTDPFSENFPDNCRDVARKIVRENNLSAKFVAPIARIIAAAHLDSNAARVLIAKLPKVKIT